MVGDHRGETKKEPGKRRNGQGLARLKDCTALWTLLAKWKVTAWAACHRPRPLVVVQLPSHVRLSVTPWTAHTRLPCPSPSTGVCSNSRPLSQ